MKPETSAFLTEAKAPTRLDFAKAKTGALGAFDTTRLIDEQAAHWLRLLAVAEVTEDDGAARAHFEEVAQTLRALRRDVAKTESELRKVVAAWRQFQSVAERIEKATAAPGGIA